MFSKLGWRTASIFFPGSLVIILGAGFFLIRPGCLGSAACIWRGVWGAIFFLGLLSLLLGLWLDRRFSQPMHQLGDVARRIASGDMNARILAHTGGEIGELTRAFTDMTIHLREEIMALNAENQQVRTVLTNMTDGVLITNTQGLLRLINPAAERLFDMPAESAIGRSFAEVVRHHQLIELWQKGQRLRLKQVEAVEISRDLFLETAVIPFQENGNRGFLVILHDLTQVRHLQTVRRDFVSNISHELRTPLASLKAVVETLQDGAIDDPPAAHHFLEKADNEVDVLTQMVEELLELSRIESGQVPFKFKLTAVSDLLLTPLDRLRPQARRKEINLVLDVAANLPPVLADEERMQRVVTNLIHNAIKFTPDGGTITLTAVAGAERAEIVIAVQDTGIGIAADELSRIFERFYKSDRARTRQRGGTGLGLAICRHIVQAHHGRIWVTSREGKGSTFTFTLPVAD